MNVCLQHISTFSLSQKGKVLAFSLGEKTKAKQIKTAGKFATLEDISYLCDQKLIINRDYDSNTDEHDEY